MTSIFTRAVLLATAATVVNAGAGEVPDYTYLDAEQLTQHVAQVRAGKEPFASASRSIVKAADAALKLPRLSVVDKTQTPPSGDKHDYLSLAPYWWPNPKTADGMPWIAKDGEVNPATRGEHTDLRRLQHFLDAVHNLSLAFLCTDEEKYADKALAMLDTWFVAPETRMNPHLKYGQAVPGQNEGRPAGVIEMTGIDQALTAIQILDQRKRLPPATRTALHRWFSDYLTWLQNSPEGKAEGRAKNNHSTHYDTQVIGILLFLGRREEAVRVLEEVKTKRVAVQIQPDGSMPAELARTKSLSYSIMNLRGFTRLARLGRQVDVDLWSYKTEDGRSIQQAYRFLAPFADGSKPWDRKQIADPEGMLKKELPRLFALAAAMMEDPAFYPAIVARAPKPDASTAICFGAGKEP